MHDTRATSLLLFRRTKLYCPEVCNAYVPIRFVFTGSAPPLSPTIYLLAHFYQV